MQMYFSLRRVVLFIATVLDVYFCTPENHGKITLIFMVFMNFSMVFVP
jgi:hypothetical protein